MNTKNIFVSGIAVLALVLSVFAFSRPGTEVVRVTDAPSVGSVSSPDISSPYFSYGGVVHWGSRTTNLGVATTTVCALRAPSATSTLQLGASGIKLTTSSTTASTLRLSKSNVPYDVSSTFLFGANVGANAQATIVATTSADTFTFAPNQYLIAQMSGGTGTFSPSGSCQATWVQI